jgi:hypothetical protein
MTPARAVLLAKRSTYLRALDATVSWCADNEAPWKENGEEKEEFTIVMPSIRYGDLPCLHTFTASITDGAPSWLIGALH